MAEAGATSLARAAPLRASQAVAPDEFTFDIVPAKQFVRATVEARFKIAQPNLAEIDRH